MEGRHDKEMAMQQLEIIKRHKVLAGNVPLCLDDNEDDPGEKRQVRSSVPRQEGRWPAAPLDRKGNDTEGLAMGGAVRRSLWNALVFPLNQEGGSAC